MNATPVLSDDVIRALLDPATPTNDPVLQFFENLLGGFGYDLYDARNAARANDLLVREKGSGELAEAARALGDLERAYRARYVPPSTREQPYPPAEETRRASRLHAIERRLDELASSLLTAEVPASDAIWSRVRDQLGTLRNLVRADLALVVAIRDVVARCAALDVAGARDDARLDDLEHGVRGFAALLADRRRALTV